MLHGDSSRKGCLAGCGTACSGLLKQILSSSDCQSTNTVEPQLMWHVRAVTWRDLVLFCPMCCALPAWYIQSWESYQCPDGMWDDKDVSAIVLLSVHSN